MSSINVLIVDDSAFMRKMLTEILERDPAICVVGAARDGADGLAKAEKLHPSVITLDVEMPVMDGYSTLVELMKNRPVPVVMVSSLTQAGAEMTMRCLSAGAVDFVGKPSGSISLDIERVAAELIAKVKVAAVSQVKAMSSPPKPAASPLGGPLTPNNGGTGLNGSVPMAGVVTSEKAVPLAQHSAAAAKVPVRSTRGPLSGSAKIVVIGASTGGPRALHALVAGLGPTFDSAGIIVQHMPAGFTQSLAKRLDAAGPATVREAVDGEPLQAGTLLVAPGGYHLIVRPDATVHLTQEPPIHGVRPAIDVTLDSVAHVFGNRVVAVLLTGMGKDGARGMKVLRDMGAHTLAEDASTCVVFGMPKAALEMNAVDKMLPLGELAQAVMAATSHSMNAAA